MLSFLSCKLINNYVDREVTISQIYYPWSGDRFIIVCMYSTKLFNKKRLLFKRVYKVFTYRDFDSMYYKLLDHYKSCTCKKPIGIIEYEK